MECGSVYETDTYVQRVNVMEPQAGISGAEMLDFVRSSINGSGEKLPKVAILRKQGQELDRQNPFVHVQAGVLNDNGDGYDAFDVVVPFENYSWTALDGRTYNKLMDYVSCELTGDSLCELFGKGMTAKVYSV
jgi:hypothetical protein